MREIEIKARLKDLPGMLDLIEANDIRLSEPVTQRDQVFGVAGVEGGDDNREAWLRIRTEEQGQEMRHIFTLKRSVTSQLDSIEHETIIDDPAEMQAIILQLGYEPYVDITKTRRRAKVGDIEICIDTVENLGNFVEVEKLTSDDADLKAVMNHLWTFLEKFGVIPADQVTDGYDVLMRQS